MMMKKETKNHDEKLGQTQICNKAAQCRKFGFSLPEHTFIICPPTQLRL